MLINEKNIEALLYDYAEGNLSQKERNQVDLFLLENPQYKEMLSEYDTSVVVPKQEDVVFANKENIVSDIMKQSPKKTIIITKYVKWFSAMAAMFLLVFGIKTFYELNLVNNSKTNSLPSIVKVENEENNSKKLDTENTLQQNDLQIKNTNNLTKEDFKLKEEQPQEVENETKEEVEQEILLADNEVLETIIEEENVDKQTQTQEDNIVNVVDRHENYTKEVQEESRGLFGLIAKYTPIEETIENITEKTSNIISTVKESKVNKIIMNFKERRNRDRQPVYEKKKVIKKINA
ncbi:MAG: hypothetical protein IJ213_02305 [Bacteroidales bacterium]|nr:hypothetical protein [Bacteroidales bacterium]